MNTTIKKRIEEINSGRVPERYETTSFGIFPCDWKKSVLKDICEINPKTEKLPELFVYIDLESVVDGKLIQENIISKKNAPSRAQRVLEKNDVIYQMVRPYQKNNFIFQEENAKYKSVASTGYAQLRSKSYGFLYQIVNSEYFCEQVLKKCTGTNYPAINSNALGEIKVFYPKSAQEQSRIAEILMQWDKAIELQEKLIKSYQKLKKYYLSKMFPKKGSQYPEIRFAGFTEPWEQRNASEIAEYDKGSGYSKCDLVESGTPVILYGRLYTKYQFAIDEVDTFAKIKDGAVLSKGGEVIIPASGETAEDIARASAITISGVLLGGDLNILRPYTFLNPIFLALSISNGESKNQLAKKAQGKTIVHIHNSDIKEVSIFYPSKEEQDKIVAFFRSLDNISSLFQGRLNKLIEQRKALQQYLLTGIVRV